MQGCDMLSAAINAVIFMPDFFEGEPLSLSAFPPDTDEKKKIVEEFRITKTPMGPHMDEMKAVIATAKGKEEWKGLPWGGYGLCWGGKMVVLQSGKDTPFKASGQAHPGRLEVEDVKAITIPHICLFSKEDGSPELIEEYGNALKEKKENVVEKYETMVHGWMAARSDFGDAEVVKEFERGYGQLADFFTKYM